MLPSARGSVTGREERGLVGGRDIRQALDGPCAHGAQCGPIHMARPDYARPRGQDVGEWVLG